MASSSRAEKDTYDEQRLVVARKSLVAAQAQLKKITRHELVEMKSFGAPPAGVKKVLEAICVLKGVKPERVKDSEGKLVNEYWRVSQKLLSNDKEFLAFLNHVDASTLPPEIMAKLRQDYLSDAAFSPASVKKVSRACAGMCEWLHALVDFYEANHKIDSRRNSQASCGKASSKQSTPPSSKHSSPPASVRSEKSHKSGSRHDGTPRSHRSENGHCDEPTPSGSGNVTPIPRPKLGSTPYTPLSAMEIQQHECQQQQLEYELPRRTTDQTLVFIRFRRELYESFKNSVVKSKSIIRNYTGSFIGAAREMTMISNGGPSQDCNITVGVLCFQRLDKCKLWAISDTNLKQQDWLDGVDQVAVPLYEPMEDGCVFQVLNLIVKDADDFYGRYLPKLDQAVAKYKGKVIAKSPQNIKFRGLWEPHFVIVVQWDCQSDIDKFHISEDNPPTGCNHGQVAQFQVSHSYDM